MMNEIVRTYYDRDVVISSENNPKLHAIHANYIMAVGDFSAKNSFKSRIQAVEGMPNVKWQVKLPCHEYGTLNWGIFLDITTHVPVKCEVSFEMTSNNNSVIQKFSEILRGSKIIGTMQFVSNTDFISKLENDAVLTLDVKAEFSYTSKEDQRIYGAKKLIQNIDWSKRLQSHGQKDFKLVVGNESVEIHKFFLTLESSVIDTMLKNPNFKETQTGEMIITDFKFNTVKAVVAFCYGEDISEFIKITENAIELLMFADKYDMANLKASCEEYYSEKLTKANVANIINAAHKYNSNGLKTLCIDFIRALPNNEQQIAIANGSLDEELREFFNV